MAKCRTALVEIQLHSLVIAIKAPGCIYYFCNLCNRPQPRLAATKSAAPNGLKSELLTRGGPANHATLECGVSAAFESAGIPRTPDASRRSPAPMPRRVIREIRGRLLFETGPRGDARARSHLLIVRAGFGQGAVAPVMAGMAEILFRLVGIGLRQGGDIHRFSAKMFAKRSRIHSRFPRFIMPP
jgi:hypothetical protein